MALKLSVVTPEAEATQMEADEVVVPGVNGEIGFMPGHVPMITAVRPGVLTIVRGGKRTFLAIGSGFAEVENDIVTVLAEAAEEAGQIDVARAKKSLSDAEERLKTVGPDDPQYGETWRRIARANARLEASQRR